LDQWGAGNVTDTGNVTATGNVAWRRETMTFSPIISAAGTTSDPTPAPAPAAEPAPGHAGYPAGPGDAGSTAGADQDYATAGTGQDHATAGTGQDYATAGTGQDYAAGSGQEDGTGAAWPYQSYLELGALPTAAPCARLHTTLMLWEWELGTLVRTAALIVSELVSNAVQASVELTASRFAGQWAPGTPPVRVWLSADEHRVVIQVWDGSDRPPVPQPVAPEADSGRGLLLVGALSAEWGCYTPEKSSGKVVWAVVTG
jgi:hypothetical protein